jgi:5'(3')-deoxyribonucleotidase
MKKIIGVDIDGVLADFNKGFREVLKTVSGRDLFNGEVWPPCWDWPTHYGYTPEEIAAAWQAVATNPTFWSSLDHYEDARPMLKALVAQVREEDAEVYFITSRYESKGLHGQSLMWLLRKSLGFLRPGEAVLPTVVIARGNKGLLAQGLGLTHFVDDKPENCVSVALANPRCVVVLLRRSYNQGQALQLWQDYKIVNVASLSEFVEEL